jgi:hypothetical protein
MATTFFSGPYELSSYDPAMYQLPQYDQNDPTLSGSHFSNFPQLHCGDPSLDFAYFPIYPLTTCVDATSYHQLEGAPVAIDPQVLHTPACHEPHVEDVLCDCARSTPELVSTPQPPPQVTIPEAYETFNPPTPARAEVYPMKKDRQKGSANLLRSVCPAPLQFQCSLSACPPNRSHHVDILCEQAKDPDRQHQCTMCIRKFKRRADLARHIKRHQGIRPYGCVARCCPLDPSERHFFRADARQRHWKAHPQCEVEFYSTEAGAEW